MFNKNNIAYLFLFFAILFWSGNFIVGKAASLYEIPPFSLNFYRWFFAWLILAPFTFKEILKKKNYILQNFKLFLILGITSITIFNSIVYYSLNFTQVISGVLMISTIPVMIIFISSILKIEKTNRFQIIGVISIETILLYIGCIFWTLGYDTIYAYQDRFDDIKYNIKSTAVLFGYNGKVYVMIFYIIFFF